MMNWDPKILLGLGLLLLVLGVVLPFLMIVHMLESTLFLNFFVFFAQLAGVILGFLGSMMIVRNNRRRDR